MPPSKCQGPQRFCHPVGDAAVSEEPRGDDQPAGATIPQALRGLGDRRVRSGGECHLDAGPLRPCRERGRHRRRAGVRGLVRGAHRHHDTPRSAIAGRYPRLGQALPEDVINAGSSPSTSASGRPCRIAVDHRRDVDAGVVGVGQQHRHHDGRPGCRRTSASTSPRFGPHCLKERGSDVQPRPQPPHGARPRRAPPRQNGDPRCRGRRGRGSPSRGFVPHDACSPHSVFD